MDYKLIKTCAVCNREFEKPSKECWKQWKTRRVCSPVCAIRIRTIDAQAKTERKCIYCHRLLKVDQFRSRSNGLPLSYCKNCDLIKGRERYRENKRAYIPRKRIWKKSEKTIARALKNNAIRNGTLQRQPCGVCGKKAEAHHPDYSKPLSVRWLCPLHHGIIHRKPLSVENV